MDALHSSTPHRTRRAMLVALGMAIVFATGEAATAAAADRAGSTRDAASRSTRGSGFDDRRGSRDSIALGVTMQGGSIADLDAFSASIGGRRPALWSVSVKWGSDRARHFPTGRARALAARGVVPFVWWTPIDPERPDDAAFAYRRIAAGRHDAYIARFARAARAHRKLVLLRFAHEFNGRYFRWAVGSSGGHDIASFKAAWRRIWRIFDRQGASNVGFVWSVVKRRCPGECNPYREYYPGDRFVDYLGFSSYNWGLQKRRWVGMADTYRRTVRRLGEVADKPVIVSETGTSAWGGNKARWIARGYREVHRELPRIRAIVYTNVDLRHIGHPDWRLTAPSAALRAYAAVAAMPAFMGRIRNR